ncbi:Legume lectin domain protein [Carnobacterium maltaromaticum]|uniref:L-type lectin-domain containing protein n=1 Tax=Carnobacterium maltaromaticum TaxID=2751 RepID=UPI00191BBF91|nr:L-type lectin-domain containing protein [Carnobacterium maltaromaticum]CAD5897453.1 Legume lectin domain protein [Carnobacterium maltaromaticum]
MKISKKLIVFFGVLGLVISLSLTVEASQPPISLPLGDVFAVPNGANSYVDGNITVITKDSNYQTGSIFSTEGNKLDLNQSFHAEMYIYLGDRRETAADGMTFVMHADKNRTVNFTGGTGAQLGVYPKAGWSWLMQQIEKSFVVEFDTYYNNDVLGDQMDKTINMNDNKGHVAYAFPDTLSSYGLNSKGRIESLNHQGVYYPNDYLSNGKWHLFSVDWDAEKNILAYNFDDAPTVSVPINPNAVFGTTSVYWGFTGSTGGFSQEAKVAFKQIPGLVNVGSSMKVTKNGKDIANTTILGGDGDVKIQYDLKYFGGKQNLLNAVFNLDLDEFLSFKPGTLTVNDTIMSDEYFVNGKLKYNLPTDMTTENSNFRISFIGTPKIATDENIKTTIDYSITGKNYFGNNLKTEFSIEKVNIIKSSYFENQSWLINEINRQLAPKKIDVDVFDRDLAKITKIDLTSAPKVIGEHIPRTIDSLINLNSFRLANQKLSGALPEEVGNLSKLRYLSIYGNSFDGEIPQSIGKLQELLLIALDDNDLIGRVPAAIASLPKLNQISLNGNKLSGQLPDFRMSMGLINIKDTQVTYNLATVPSFLTSAKSKNYTKTFIGGLKLTGTSRVISKSEQIKPFDKTNEGYFDLKVMDEMQPINLVEEHIYTIKNTIDGTIYYKGRDNPQVIIPYKKGISYTVILDEAEKNPNNVFTVLGKEHELKFAEIPSAINLKIKLGSEKQAVIPEGNLAVFDNRENKQWKLSITLSELTEGQKKLQGEYSYTTKTGVSFPIASGQKFLLETGESDSVNEVIQVSNSLGTNYGLGYTAYRSNYIGNYKGSVIWTLEDAP